MTKAKSRPRTQYAQLGALVENYGVPSAREFPSGPYVPQVSFSEAMNMDQATRADSFDYYRRIIFLHEDIMTNYLSHVKTNDPILHPKSSCGIIWGMEIKDRPYSDIAARIRWHRELEGLTQKEYALKIGQKRAALNNWESGDYRLSLDGALAIRKTYELSLDFMYEGIADALPMTLRAAWLESPLVKNSK